MDGLFKSSEASDEVVAVIGTLVNWTDVAVVALSTSLVSCKTVSSSEEL